MTVRALSRQSAPGSTSARALSRRRKDAGAPAAEARLDSTRAQGSAPDAAAGLRIVDPVVSLLADMHTALGNAGVGGMDLGADSGLSFGLHTHAAGSLALGVAGFDTSAMSPGGALRAMREVMRRSQAEEEGLDTSRAAKHIGSRQGQPLPELVRVRMERAFGHDFSHVRVHIDGAAADAAQDLNAMAFAIGSDLYFGRGAWSPGTPRGDELLAHELTHVVQADQNRLPGPRGPGMDVSSPTDRHEQEAVAMGRKVAQELGRSGGGALDLAGPAGSPGADHAPAEQATPAVGLPGAEGAAADQDAGGVDVQALFAGLSVGSDGGGGDAGGGEGGGEGLVSRDFGSWWSSMFGSNTRAQLPPRTNTPPSNSASGQSAGNAGRGTGSGNNAQAQGPGAANEQNPDATLTLAGRTIRVSRPAGSGDQPTLTAELNQQVLPGLTLTTASLQFNEQGAVVGGTVRAQVRIGEHLSADGLTLSISEGGRVSPTIDNVQVRLGETIQATVRLTVGRDAITGAGTIGFEQLPLPAQLGISSGQLQVAVDAQGVRAAGTLSGTMPNVGTVRAETGFRDNQLGARVTVTVNPGLAPVPGVVFQSGQLDGSWLQGQPAVAFTGDLQVQVKDWLTGTVHAQYKPEGGTWSVTGDLAQSGQLTLGELVVLQGRVKLVINENQLTAGEAAVNIQTPKVQGQLQGSYDVQKHELTGTAAVSLNHDWPMEAGWGAFTLKQGGALSAEVQANVIKALTGDVPFTATVQGGATTPLQIEGQVSGALNIETQKFDGTANGALTADLQLPVGANGDQLRVLTGSRVTATLAQNALTQVGLNLNLQLHREGALFLSGTVPDAVYDVASGKLNGTGRLRLEKALEHETADGQWKTVVKAGSQLEAKVVQSELTELGGSGEFAVHDSAGPLLDGTVSAAKIDLTTKKVSGQLQLQTARPFLHPRKSGGVIEGTPGWLLEVQQGSGVTGTMADSQLTRLTADLRAKVNDPGGHLLNLSANADWDMVADTVDGQGKAQLARDVVLAEAMGPEGWKATALKDAEATGHLEQNKLTKITGALKVGVDDAEGRFVELEGGATWLMEGNKLDMTSTAKVVREKLVGTAGAYAVLIQKETAATGTVEQNDLKQVQGNLKSKVTKDGADFAKADLDGTWKQGEGVTGTGAAELLTEQDVAQVGRYHLFLEKGTGATLKVERSEVKEIGGQVPMRIDEEGQGFIKGKVAGTYKMTEKKLSGTGEAEVLAEKRLGQLGQDQLWLMPGSGATVTLAENALTQVGGNIQLSTRDNNGEYATIALQGTFDAAGGTGFTGSGAATVKREKELFRANNYTFLIMPGTGATAHIAQDKLTKLDGQVPFEVRDAQGALFGGKVGGDYNPETGKVNGSGDIKLGRDLSYDLGGGTTLKLLQGSGGDAEVKDSELKKVGGTLKAELWKNGQAQARITANGTYNAVTNKLEELTGEAELLRPMDMLGGEIRLTNVKGTGTIRDNELVQLGGQGEITIPKLNNMHGKFDVNWRNEGGRDIYEGSGELDFTLFNDPAKGRSMTGKVQAQYNADDTFAVQGEVKYAMNELIKDLTVGVQMDQTLDPKLSLSTTIQTNLVDARTLFSMEKDLVPRTSVPIYGPFGLFFGMKGGMSMGLRALQMTAGINVADWRPISEGSEVPTFSANLDLDWGMDFSAKIAPYIGLEGNLRVAQIGAGVRGEVALDAPISVNPSGKIEGGPQGFSGELSVGVSIKPRLDLSLTPFVQASITGLDPWQHDFDSFQQPLGEVFSFEWGRKYSFGDQSSRSSAPTTQVPAPPAQQRQTEQRGVPNTGFSNGAGQANNMKGGPQLESGSTIAGQQQTGDASLDRLMGIVNDIKVMAEGIGALGELVSLVIGIIQATATFGPIGMVIYCVWKIFKGELSWDGIKTAVQKVVAAVQTAGRLLRPHLPAWFQKIVDLFSGDKPGLLDALFGADDRMRESVRKGEHRHAPADMRAEMIKVMDGGWISEDDEECILEILKFSASRGDLSSVVSMSGGADHLLGVLDGREDDEARQLFRRAGIAF
ncbi:MAG: DUF4157 domain-containing protein [Deltaproteobacteria bacterium]|nr:DUF4157 domain-containing protein [Deltaproteobacteria bacterium]